MFWNTLQKFTKDTELHRWARLAERYPQRTTAYLSPVKLLELSDHHDLHLDTRHRLAEEGLYSLLRDGRRHHPSIRATLESRLADQSGRTGDLFAPDGPVMELYSTCTQYRDWCRADKEFLQMLIDLNLEGNSSAVRAVSRYIREETRRDHTRCRVLAVHQDGGSSFCRPGVILEWDLSSHPNESPPELNRFPSAWRSEFSHTIRWISRNLDRWFDMTAASFLPPDSIEGRSGGMTLWLAQYLAYRGRPFPGRWGISVAIDERGLTGDIGKETVKGKIELALSAGWRMLFLPETVREQIDDPPKEMEIHYLPVGISPQEAWDNMVEVLLEKGNEELDLSQEELKKLVKKGERLYREREINPWAVVDVDRAQSIFNLVVEETRTHLPHRGIHLRARLNLLRLANHRADGTWAEEMAAVMEELFEECRNQQLLTYEDQGTYWNFMNSWSISLMDGYRYEQAEKMLKIIEREAGFLGPHTRGKVYGSLGQLYLFLMETDRKYDSEAWECLEESYRLISEFAPDEVHRQLNYLIKYWAIRGEVEPAREYLDQRRGWWEQVDDLSNYYFCQEELRLYLTAYRGRHLDRSRERDKNALDRGYQLVRDCTPWVERQLGGGSSYGFWVLGHVLRYMGALVGAWGRQEEGEKWLSRALDVWEEGDPGIERGEGREAYFPDYAAVWAESALLGLEAFRGKNPVGMVKEILSRCRDQYRREKFAWVIGAESLGEDDLIALAQTVHY